MGETNKSVLSLNNVFDLKGEGAFQYKRFEENIWVGCFRFINFLKKFIVFCVWIMLYKTKQNFIRKKKPLQGYKYSSNWFLTQNNCSFFVFVFFWFVFFLFFLYLSFLSQPFTNHKTAGQRGRHFFNTSIPLPPTSQTLGH